MQPITTTDIKEVLLQTLPAQNDFSETDYSELLGELLYLGVTTKLALLDIIVKHRETLLEIDAEPLDEEHIRWYSADYGEEYVNARVENGYWFSFQALLRIALELEFGERYQEYANKRDGI